MAIEDLKRWQWMALGALVGPALGFMWAWSGSSSDGIRSVDEVQFERDVVMTDPQSGQPFIKGIVIHPAEESFDGKQVNVVTYKRLAKDKSGRVGWLDRRLIAKIPYKPAIPGQVPTDDNMTIDQYLSELARKNPNIHFSNGWWLDTKKAMLLGSLAGALALGGVWPMLMNVMIGAGLGKRTDPEELKAKHKSKFDWGSLLRRSKPAGQAGHAHQPAVTAADKAQLDQIADAYARSVGEGAVVSSGAAPGDHAADAPVRKLTGGPVEEARPLAKPEDDDEIEVKGEYYPVLIHHQKQPHSKDKPPQPGHG